MYKNWISALSALALVTITGLAGGQEWDAPSAQPASSASAPATERDASGTLLLGCSGLSVEVAQSSAPIPIGNAVLEASGLIGMPCAEVLRLLLDNGRISPADIEASSHLVVNNTPREGGDDDTVDVPDCIIWDIDTGTVSAQLACDVRNAGLIEAQRSAPGGLSDLVGMPCVDALDALGGLPNVLRSSAGRPAVVPRQENARGNVRANPIPGSLLVYQLQLYL